MSTKKFKLRKSKKYKNLVSIGLGITTAVAIGVATDTQAFANETVDNSKVETIKENIEKIENKAVTKEQVDTVKANLDKVQSEVKGQEAVVKAEETKVNTTTKELAKANKEKAELEKISKEATPEKIEETKKEVEAKKDVVTVEENKLETLKGQETAKNQEVEVAKKELETAKSELDTAKENVKQAEANLQNAKDILAGTNADKVIKALEEAKKQVELAKETVANKEKALEEAKKVDKERQDKIDTLTAQKQTTEIKLTNAKADLETKTTEYNKAVVERDKAIKELEKAQNDVDGINKIILTPEYIQALKKFMNIVDKNGKLESGNYSDEEISSAEAELKRMNNKVLALNSYKVNKNDDNKTLLDVNNLDLETRTKLSLFISDLINQIREQIGTQKVVVTPSALDFADKVAKEYVKDNFDFAKQNGHNVAGISRVASEYGMREGQYYENLAGTTSVSNKLTYSELKQNVYKAIIDFMFNGDEWRHARSIAGGQGRIEPAYLGVSFSRVNNVNAVHVIDVGKHQVEEATKNNFNITEIPNTVTAEKLQTVLETAKANYLNKADIASEAQQDKIAAEILLDDTQNTLNKVTDDLNKVTATKELTSQAQTELQTAQDKLTNDTQVLQTAQTNYDNLSADIKTKQQAVKQAEDNLKDKQQEQATKQTNYNNSSVKLLSLENELKTKQAEIKDQQKVISTAQEKVEEIKTYLEKLQNAPALLEEAKKQVELLEKKLKSEQAVLKSVQEKLAELKLQEQDLQEKYNKLSTEYNKQQKALEAERLSKELRKQSNQNKDGLVNNNVLGDKLLPKTGLETSSSLLGIILMILTLGLYRKKRI